MIKVYFGPYAQCPAKPLGGNEATLSLPEFHLIRGYDRDFWTNNPFILDVFKPEQVMVWTDRWAPLPEALAEVLPGEDKRQPRRMPPGKAALMVSVFRLVEEHCERSDATEKQTATVLEEIRAALVH